MSVTGTGSWTYSYDAGDRLTQVVNPNSETTSFSYDAAMCQYASMGGEHLPSILKSKRGHIMTYGIRQTTDHHFQIEMEGEAPNCHTLSMSPLYRELEINSGIWVAAAFALWSGPDCTCIPTILNVAREFVGSVEFGVRMFVDFNEFDLWCPELVDQASTPVWLFYREGMLVHQYGGLLNENSLQKKISEHLRIAQ